MPIFEVDTVPAENVSWSDGGAGGRFVYVDANTVAYEPANRTQVVTITGEYLGDDYTATLTVYGTYPLYPQKGYEIEADEDTKTKQARDGTLYFKEQYRRQITWKLGVDRRLFDELQEIWDFLIFHRKIKLFWIYDQERKLMNLVRRTSAIPTKFESVNSWSNSVIVKGDYDPTFFSLSGLTTVRLNCGGSQSGEFAADNFFTQGSAWDFGDAVIDDDGLLDSPGPMVLRYARYHAVKVIYEITGLLPDQNYTVELYFAGPESLDRVVNIYFQEVFVDTTAVPGDGTAIYFDATGVSDSDGMLKIEIEKDTGVNALINAIVLTAT